jgi:hypothetical protein
MLFVQSPQIGSKMLEDEHPDVSEDATSVVPTGPAPQADPSMAALFIGQATAVIAVAAAVIYAAGGLALGLRLWYDQYSWQPVLGELPKSFLLVDALIVLAFAITIAVVTYPLYERIKRSGKGQKPRPLSFWLWSVISAAALAVTPVIFLHFVRKTTLTGVIRPYWQIFVFCWMLNLFFVALGRYMLPKINVNGLQGILCIGVLTFIFIPAIASVSAAYRFPVVRLCGPTFRNQGAFGRYDTGNLIGTDGQWIYVAETLTKPSQSGKDIFAGGYIAVIPLSAVQLEGIGSDASCGDLRAVVAPTG